MDVPLLISDNFTTLYVYFEHQSIWAILVVESNFPYLENENK